MTKLSITNRNCWLVGIAVIFILIALAVAYQPVMFNFFCSDDFYIVSWLGSCKQNPMFLFQAVYEGTPYYRPVLNVLIFLEYLLCGTNSIFFRLISLFYLLVTAIILYFLLRELASKGNITKEENETSTANWCLFSIGFFLLYPLHTEPINWFVCTTELLTGLFIIFSFLLYLWWRKERKLLFGLISCFLAACAFLTKEIAVILPPILFLYEFLLGNSATDTELSKVKRLGNKLFSAIRPTSIYWFLLIIYLCLRKMMTGNFLGNWSNAVFHFSDNQTMYKAWLESLKMILVPLSSAAFHPYSASFYIWTMIVIALTALTMTDIWNNGHRLSLSLFFIGWFFICLLPMLKLFWITPDLLDARYGYIASIPLCALLMYGLAFSQKPKPLNYLRYPIFLLILSYSCFVLHMNNSAWAEAGKLTNSMLKEFSRLHKEIPDSDSIYLTNIPAKYNGVAIAGLKSIESMNDKPFLDRAYTNCIWLQGDDRMLPIGIMKHDIEHEKIYSHFYYLNILDQKFHPVSFYQFLERNSLKKNAVTKTKIAIGDHTVEVRLLKDLGKAKIISKRRTTFIWSDQEIPCWSVDALVFKVRISHKLSPKKLEIAQAAFVNDIPSSTPEANLVSFPLYPKEGEQWIVLSLKGTPIWSFGGYCHEVSVSLPRNAYPSIEAAYAVNINESMPQIKLDTPAYNTRIGQIEINDKNNELILNFDARTIDSCAGVALEVLGQNQYFKELNNLCSDTHSLIELFSMRTAGQIKLNRKQFSEPAFYKIRLRPVDKNHNQCGFCSDHFIVHVAH